ncbi:biliverdin reductase A-like [Toxotes jaculatrix]|uniref:biliverdin reductase A-like n=1 Tax=Toxotes jaculatrix TaxID=941984 RepID=UPI001B3AD023|nr:biliverdin reductase A-like [Toxotes jaculatrix]
MQTRHRRALLRQEKPGHRAESESDLSGQGREQRSDIHVAFVCTENESHEDNVRPLTWIEEQGPALPRAKNINFKSDSCTLTQIPPGPRGVVGLFMQDLIHFSAKLTGQVSPEELQREKTRILYCLELSEKIQQLCQN